MRDLVCFAQGKPGDWEGICVDFDIAVQGHSFEEVRNALEEAVSEYVAAAREEDEMTRTKLLNRRAPALVTLSWMVRVFWSGLRRSLRHHGDGDSSASFPVACAT